MRVSRWQAALSRLWSDRGSIYTEYVVLGALAVLVILGAVQYLFGGLAQMFQRMGDAIRGM